MTHSVPRTFSPSSLQDDAQHAVRGRMLRPHVEDEFVAVKKRFVGVSGPAARVRRIAHFGACLAHCPLSMPRLICTHSGPAAGWVVLAQRMALPSVRQQNALQVGMPVELDAEHVEDLALQPIGRLPNFHGSCEDARRLRCAS